ncbi:MAG TPA: ribonuclease HII [bacterium]|jgi:ribonuclease HII|nr:ribonuclease HII [bacterium]HNT65823.1 ribonuclease HII [bacterium]HOX85671.1 ribonuclease HII [bacterium]HPG44830.1 ribonuclease HII [bacterium]HPM98141.1 ribonuclease HII [bacterium]
MNPQWDLLHFEEMFWRQGHRYVAGCDEAGRGPLAGPVAAAAVIFPPFTSIIPGLTDSKQLSARKRQQLVPIIQHRALAWSVAFVDEKEIDQINILQASLKAMLLALSRLSHCAEVLLVDGNFAPKVHMPCQTLVGGDARSLSIAAASVLAKESRDAVMRRYDRLYPQYGFARHKGYPTREHVQAIRLNGLCNLHRKSFRVRLEEMQ